jgi:galactokinase
MITVRLATAAAATLGAVEPNALRQALIDREPAAARAPESIELVRGPGRVNLIGEHTDYNEGFVLPAAIGLQIVMALIPTDDRRVRIHLLSEGTMGEFDLDHLPRPSGSGIDYVAGVAWSLAAAGQPLRGVRAVLASDLPVSAGLSSSAALELAAAWALLKPEARPQSSADRMRLAQLAQRAENDYVGVRCGLMDQFASSLGQPSHAMLLDCRSLEYRAVRLPLSRHALVICDSAAPRELADSAYNARRAQCERAAAIIARRFPSVRSLRDIDEELLEAVLPLLDEETGRRVAHVVGENARVLACVTALEGGDLDTVGRSFAASHASLRDLYEVSSPELDALVDIATTAPGVIAARMTGAGFGGCTINIVEREAVPDFADAVVRGYPARTGLVPRVLPVEAAGGAGLVQ